MKVPAVLETPRKLALRAIRATKEARHSQLMELLKNPGTQIQPWDLAQQIAKLEQEIAQIDRELSDTD